MVNVTDYEKVFFYTTHPFRTPFQCRGELSLSYCVSLRIPYISRSQFARRIYLRYTG